MSFLYYRIPGSNCHEASPYPVRKLTVLKRHLYRRNKYLTSTSFPSQVCDVVLLIIFFIFFLTFLLFSEKVRLYWVVGEVYDSKVSTYRRCFQTCKSASRTGKPRGNFDQVMSYMTFMTNGRIMVIVDLIMVNMDQ